MPLYHYTSAAGLHGIMASRSLWTSHYRYVMSAAHTWFGRSIVKLRDKQDRSCGPAPASSCSALVPAPRCPSCASTAARARDQRHGSGRAASRSPAEPRNGQFQFIAPQHQRRIVIVAGGRARPINA